MQQTFSVLQLATLIAEQLGSDFPEAAMLPKRLAEVGLVPLTKFNDALRRTMATTDPSYDPRQPLPVEIKAVASSIWRTAALLTHGNENLQRIAVLFIMDRLGYRVLVGEPDLQMTFDRFHHWLQATRLSKQMLALTSDDPDAAINFINIRDRLLELQAVSYRLSGQGYFSFVANSWIQLEWYRAAITDEQLLAEGIRNRLRCAFTGLRKTDGQISRTDDVVCQLITKVKNRMAKRRQHLEDLRIAIRGICGLSPNFPIDIHVHGNHDRLDQLVSLTVRKIRERRLSHVKPTVIVVE